ncbi:uncharacterized protein E5676_scaffold302G00300 [Cucumis melo var. makuwa]|uniref:CACTA en-spm transposon protein n=1 Tax=Cucumis melo var. makuwa TaxID=1194695 RepID=A0A5D3CLU3_CUCMM|nr:uncharacterized protein E6C27_scaffold110G00660 [Cucumis melo var. makuwa]TYK12272.1 uncharacterized protein E5676_scaffold302G00300 [Cucumis melo var. makuwa]
MERVFGLSFDGFNPFGQMSTSYSMWSVVLLPYNLSPWKCMKETNFFMSLLIPGPRSPGRQIYVYLQPLIEELKELWTFEVRTYDSLTSQGRPPVFVFDFNDQAINMFVEHQMLNTFKEFQTDCHRHFKKYSDSDEARTNPPNLLVGRDDRIGTSST